MAPPGIGANVALAGFCRRGSVLGGIQQVDDDAAIEPHHMQPRAVRHCQVEGLAVSLHCSNVSRCDRGASQRHVISKAYHHVITVLIDTIGRIAIRIDNDSSKIGVVARSDGNFCWRRIHWRGVARDVPQDGQQSQDHRGSEYPRDPRSAHSKLASSLSISD
jgi:hypothetical protein